MTEGFPYDRGAFARVWRRLWELLPLYYRTLDGGDQRDAEEAAQRLAEGAPVAQHDLARLVAALAAPLAAVRQSSEELHRDLFIDSCGDGAIPLLADMVGTTLVFPDAASNRRDVRGTVRWRRRKGTPPMLEELADELTARMTPLMEGFQRLSITQDLHLLTAQRLARTTIDLRDLRVAERTSGPLDATYHFVDVRAPGPRNGRYHPRHLTHWLHFTQLFPLLHAEPAYIGDRGDPITGAVAAPTVPPALPRDEDYRYAFHPLGRYQALRARRVGVGDDLRSDRVPPMHFALTPQDYFDREGRLTIEILGIPAGVARARQDAEPIRSLAHAALLTGQHSFEQLVRARRSGDDVELALVAVALLPTAEGPVASGTKSEVAHALVTAGALGPTVQVGTAPAATVAMLRLRPASGAAGFFAGGTFALTAGLAGGDAGRWLPPSLTSQADSAELARRGQPRGAVAFEVPPTWVIGERWFYLGADGTLGEAQKTGQGAVDVALAPESRIELARVVRAGIGAAWPPLPYSADREATELMLPAPTAGPVRMHGGPVLDASGGGLNEAPTMHARLVFAIATTSVTTRYAPVGALTVGAPAASDRGRFEVLDALAQPVTAEPVVMARLRELALLVEDAQPGSQRLVVRFEAETLGAVLPPCEVSFRGASLRAVADEALLIHLPALTAASAADAAWPAPAGFRVSDDVSVARDGSSWDGEAVARAACGRIAPIGPADAGSLLLRRRQVRSRSLCPWQNEVAAHQKLGATDPGFLDVDVEHGLFALAGSEAPPLTPPAFGVRAPNVTVGYQQGASAHLGALPADRSTLLGRTAEAPTRIVSRFGVGTSGQLSARLAVPHYRTLSAALAAIDADPTRSAQEVIEIADSATYPGEALSWPGTGGGGTATRRLIIRAADGARPVLRVSSWTSSASAGFTRVVLMGLTLSSEAPLSLSPPLVDPASPEDPARATVEFTLSTIAAEHLTLSILAPAEGAQLMVTRSITAALALNGVGQIDVRGSVVDPGDRARSAVALSDGVLTVDRCSVLGVVSVDVLEASESIFMGVISVADRFRGCIRFSRVELGSVLPRRHRVVPDLDVTPAVSVEVRMVSVDRHDPAYARLAEACDARVQFGAADGGEMGAFHDEQWPVRREAVLRRLSEYTPAGMVSGLIRMD